MRNETGAATHTHTHIHLERFYGHYYIVNVSIKKYTIYLRRDFSAMAIEK